MNHSLDFTPEEMRERADNLAAMERNDLMRNSGVFDAAQLEDFLSTSRVNGTSDAAQFIGFDVVFGFDESGRDFVAIKDRADDGTHVVFASPVRIKPKHGQPAQ
jgi:hypothetical protein